MPKHLPGSITQGDGGMGASGIAAMALAKRFVPAAIGVGVRLVGVTQASKAALQLSSDAEQAQAAFEALKNDLVVATKLMDEMRNSTSHLRSISQASQKLASS